MRPRPHVEGSAGVGFTLLSIANHAVAAFRGCSIFLKKGNLLICCSLGSDSSAKYHPKVSSVDLKSSYQLDTLEIKPWMNVQM